MIRPELADDPRFIRQFETEAQVIARLEHPRIVPLYDYWREPGAAYLVMRLLRGGSLKETLARGSLGFDRAIEVVANVAEALGAAHQHGVVHCDVRPANVLLDSDGHAYLSDFGICERGHDEPEPAAGGSAGWPAGCGTAARQMVGSRLTGRLRRRSLRGGS